MIIKKYLKIQANIKIEYHWYKLVDWGLSLYIYLLSYLIFNFDY